MAAISSQLSGSQLLPGSRAAGISLMAGVVIAFFPSLFTPGGPLIDPVAPTDYRGTLDVLAVYPSLAHLAAMLAVISMLLYGYGLLGLWGLPNRAGGRGSALLHYGIMTSLFGWGIFIVAMGMRHMTIHLMQRSVEFVGEPEAYAAFLNTAVSGYADMAGLVLAFLCIFPFASILVGVGLASRFSSMNIYKIASIGLVVIGVAGYVNFLTAQHFPEYDLTLLVYINNMVLSIGAICLFIIGVGMYRGREELVQQEAAES